jgi:hypothetical protein
MKNWINKSEAVMALTQGGRIVSHDLKHWIEGPRGEYKGEIRYSLWRILSKITKQVGMERRPPSTLRYYFWKLVK